MAQFVDTELKRIPYNKLVEVPVAVFNGGDFGAGSLTLCNDFVDVEIILSSTCEIPSSSGQVYQYGVIQDPVTKLVSVSYDPRNRIYPANSTASLSVSWPTQRRRLSNDSAEEGIGGVIESRLLSLDGSIDGLNSVVGSKLEILNTELMVAFNSSVDVKVKLLEHKVAAMESTISDMHETVTAKLNHLANAMDKKMEVIDDTMGGKIDDLTASFSFLEQKLIKAVQSPSPDVIDKFSSLLLLMLIVLCTLSFNYYLWWSMKKNVVNGTKIEV
mmetsp:Transcript_26485/g.36425  ORF Transcript_26485/g.36425 Transcript_26485/m.36425 type:complete len:272 (+) Transcript_26485:714-1529(+)